MLSPRRVRPGKEVRAPLTSVPVGHAVLGAYKRASRRSPAALKWWAATGQAKVCVKVPTEGELLDLKRQLNAAGIVAYLVEDAGRTQVAPGSKTVLAVGPAPVKVLDPFTKHLKLY